MREILFRGQTRRYGEKVRMGDGEKLPGRWVYGGVLQGSGAHSIIYGGENENDPGEGLDKWVVYSDTLGQFTGLLDKNGKRIFEGDIVRDVDTGNIRTVEYHGNRFVFVSLLRHFFDVIYEEDCEVIGNIHDNPELLTGGANDV